MLRLEQGVRFKLLWHAFWFNASLQTRHGDWVMRMRFRGENTRETEGSERRRLWARAFPPEARSHHPITAPDRFGVKPFSPTDRFDLPPCLT
ncbi:MAG: hypothetical protein BWK72_03065 [Rhodoferax ferrireducens]|uniref:Uncharacterized protein n=1 Tax=Rhodoferax ferrireducens TaxID=192843 RepID=A0A1W9KZQ4_9BURK|nr:MAG: hypothetical protein BWK72_03065 [Rhodoferax ferrireducens]